MSKTTQHHEYIGRLIQCTSIVVSSSKKVEEKKTEGQKVERQKGRNFGGNFLENVRNFFRDCGKDERKIRAKEKKTTERKTRR